MPKLKTYKIAHSVANTKVMATFDISVNSNGEFYANIGDEFLEAAGGLIDASRTGKNQVFSSTLPSLEETLREILARYATPETTETNVIRYNIDPRVNFCNTRDGDVIPNGYWPGSTGWNDHEKYGDSFGRRNHPGGYSITIGAVAVVKKVTRFGDTEKVEYDRYYKGKSHLGVENPAQKLNSWSHVSLPDDAKEIPYSDEAALFFHELMMGVARLSKLIQENTYNESVLFDYINSGEKLLGVLEPGHQEEEEHF